MSSALRELFEETGLLLDSKCRRVNVPQSEKVLFFFIFHFGFELNLVYVYRKYQNFLFE